MSESRGRGRPPTLIPLTDAERDRIDPDAIETALRVAATFARHSPRYRDELESAALFGLIRATRRYDPDRGMDWLPFVAVLARNECSDMLRMLRPLGFRRPTTKHAPRPRTVSLYATDSELTHDEPDTVELPHNLFRHTPSSLRPHLIALFQPDPERTYPLDPKSRRYRSRACQHLRALGREEVVRLLGLS